MYSVNCVMNFVKNVKKDAFWGILYIYTYKKCFLNNNIGFANLLAITYRNIQLDNDQAPLYVDFCLFNIATGVFMQRFFGFT